jgi:hypothetical protein
MNTVWVLVSLVYSGHFVNTIVPTMEFSTQQKCEAAIVVFEQDAQSKTGSARMRCVRIEK